MALTNYLSELRAIVGHRLLLLPSISVLPLDEENDSILLRRHADFNSWGLIGGTLDLDEPPLAGVARKAADVGIDVSHVNLVYTFGGPDFHLVYPSGDQVAVVGTLFTADLASSLSENVQWFKPAQAADLNLISLSRAILHHAGILPTSTNESRVIHPRLVAQALRNKQ